MQLFAMASAVLTIVAGTWVGQKLFRLSRRTGQAPERYIGIGMLSFGAVAYPLFLVLVLAGTSLSREVGIGVSIGANTAYIVCLLTTALFTRIVFRPTAAWSVLLVALIGVLGILGSGLTTWHTIVNPGIARVSDPLSRVGSAMLSAAFALGFCWTSIEAFLYRGALGKRLALGLADPVVVNRFSVWAIGTAIACITDIGLITTSLLGLNPATNPLPPLLQSTSGLACTITWTLTFAPSAAYLNWVRKRAGGATT